MLLFFWKLIPSIHDMYLYILQINIYMLIDEKMSFLLLPDSSMSLKIKNCIISRRQESTAFSYFPFSVMHAMIVCK